MNHVLFIIPILLAVTIPNAFAQVETNVDESFIEQINLTNSTTVEPFDQEFQYTLDDNPFQFNTGSNMIFINSNCSVQIKDYSNNIVFENDDYIVRVSDYDLDNWTDMEINNSSCNVFGYDNAESLEYGKGVKTVQENFEGILTKYYDITNPEKTKVSVEFENKFYPNSKFMTYEQITLADQNITFNGDQIDLANFVGQSFDRSILDNYTDVLIGFNDDSAWYQSEVGFENLWSVDLIDSNKINLNYGKTDTLTPIGEKYVLDPLIWGTSSSTQNSVLSFDSANWVKSGSGSDISTATKFDLSYGSHSAWVFGYNTMSASDFNNQLAGNDFTWIGSIRNSHDYYQVGVKMIFTNGDELYCRSWSTNAGTSGVKAGCSSTPQGLSYTTGAAGTADVSISKSGNTYTMNYKGYTKSITSQTLDSVQMWEGRWTYAYSSNIDFTTKSFNDPNYVPPTVPTAPQTLTTSQSTANEIILNWLSPSSDGNSAITNYKIYLDGSLIDTIGNVLTYTDTISGSEIGSGLTYSVIAVNSVGDSPASNNSFITSWNVPDAPTGFQAVTGVPITMSWVTPNSDDTITNYKIYRDGTLLDTITPANSYTDNNTVAGNSYVYEISAISAVGEGPLSASSTATAGISWNPPGSVSAVISDPDNSPFDISVSWSASTQGSGTGTLTGYEVWRTNGATTVLVSTLGNVLTYSDTVSLANTNFEYFVKSTSTHGTSGNSPVSNTVTTANIPDAITDLSGNIISDTQINISWTAPNDGGSNIDLYKIFRDGSQIDTTTNTSYSLTGLTANTSYTITVFSNNSVGDSLVSNSVTLTTYVPVSGSITVTPNTQGATTQLTFSASGITGTPTPTFSTFTLKEGVNVIASGITSPYTLTLNDNNAHTFTITSTDNTHWNTPTISGSTTVTASYDPNWSNGISYNYTRASGVMDLIVNRDTQSLWGATCSYKTTAQVMADQSGIVSNFTNVWYINDSQNIADTDTVYVSCNEDGTTLFSFTSFGPNRLGGGIAQLDAVFGEWTGTPVALIFVLLVAGLFTGRSAPTGILLVLALIGVLGFIGMLTIDEAVWGFLLLAGVLGIFLGKRFL